MEQREDISFEASPNSRVKWRPWSAASFAEAEDRDIPIALFLGASWSGLSRMVNDEVFRDRSLSRELNRRSIPIRVDAERRPDVADRYTFSGWPTVAFLTPGGDVIACATGMEAGELLAMARRINGLWRKNRQDLLFHSQGQRRDLLWCELDTGRRSALGRRRADEVIERLLKARLGFDSYPNHPAIELFIRASRRGRPELLDIAVTALDTLLEEAYDHRRGGIVSPAKVKALAANAAACSNLFLAYRVTRDDRYIDAAMQTLSFIDDHLSTGDGGFRSFERRVDKGNGRVVSEVGTRASTDACAITVCALIDAHLATRQERYLERALITLDYLWSRFFEPFRGMAHYLDDEGKPRLFGRLEDQAWAMLAFIKAWLATGERGHTIRAHELFDIARDQTLSGDYFFDIPYDDYAGGLLIHRLIPVGGNSVMARSLALLSAASSEEELRDLAESILGSLKLRTDVPLVELACYGLSVFQLIERPAAPRRAA